MTIFLFWVALSIAIGVAAGRRGRNGAGWFLLSILISPLLAVCFLLAVGPKAVDVAKLQPVADWSKVDWSGEVKPFQEPREASAAKVVVLTILGTFVFFAALLTLLSFVGG